MAVSLEHLSETTNNSKAKVLADTLDAATEKLLENKKGPSRKVNEIDNRGSHFYLAMYWAQELATQNKDSELKNQFTKIAEELKNSETIIIDELNSIQGAAVSIDGYYDPNEALVSQAMRPSNTFNAIIKS